MIIYKIKVHNKLLFDDVEYFTKKNIYTRSLPMQIEITPEALLKQFKLSVNSQSLDQMDAIINKTKGSKQFLKHIFSLNDSLASLNAFVAPSNSVELLKIKYHGNHDEETLDKFHEAVNHWGNKYNVELEKVDTKETYYIKGRAS